MYIIKANINGKKYVNFADASPSIAHDGKMISRYGKKCGMAVMLLIILMMIMDM